MKKIIINILFVLMPLLLINFSGLMLTKSENYFKIDNSINKLIIGASGTQCAINDTIVRNAINLSMGGDSYFDSFVKLRKFTKHNPNIDTVILSSPYISLSKRIDEWWSLNSSHSIQKYKSYFHLYTYDDIIYILNKNPSAFIKASFLLVRRMLKVIAQSIIKKNHFTNLKIGGYVYLDKDELQSEIKKISQNTNIDTLQFEKSLQQTRYLTKISDYCNKNDLTLILIITPVHNTIERTYKNEKSIYFDFVKNHLSEHKILNHSKIKMPDYGFGDCVHLNYKGATIYSEILRDSL